MLVGAAGGGGLRLIVETLEASEDDSQSCACCVALLNACHQHLPSRDLLLDCSGVNALVTCLASDNTDVKAAAAGTPDPDLPRKPSRSTRARRAAPCRAQLAALPLC